MVRRRAASLAERLVCRIAAQGDESRQCGVFFRRQRAGLPQAMQEDTAGMIAAMLQPPDVGSVIAVLRGAPASSLAMPGNVKQRSASDELLHAWYTWL